MALSSALDCLRPNRSEPRGEIVQQLGASPQDLRQVYPFAKGADHWRIAQIYKSVTDECSSRLQLFVCESWNSKRFQVCSQAAFVNDSSS